MKIRADHVVDVSMKRLLLVLALLGCGASPEDAAPTTPTEETSVVTETSTLEETTAMETSIADTAVADTTTSEETITADTAMAVDAPPACGAVALSGVLSTPTATTKTAANSTKTSCGGDKGLDAIFQLTIPTRSTVKVDGFSSDTEVLKDFPSLAIRSTCEGADIACSPSIAPHVETTLDPGTYFIVVDSDRTTPSEWTVRATITPLADCAAAKPLVFTSGKAKASGDTSTGKNFAVGCDSSTSPDHVYSFELTETKRFAATLTTTSPTYKPAMYLRRSCDDPTSLVEQSCAWTSLSQTLPAGKYFLFVDGLVGTSGAYDLDVTLSAPVAGDSCANPIAMPFVSGVAKYSGTTADGTNDFRFSCGGVTNDKVHSFTITTLSRVTFGLTTTAIGYDPIFSVRSACATASSELQCGLPGMKSTPRMGYAFPGTYYLIVDGLFIASDVGPYTLEIKTDVPLPGEVCENVETLTLGTPISGSNELYGNDIGGPDSGNDRVWTFTETVASTRKVTFSTPAYGWVGRVSVQEGTCENAPTSIASVANKNDGKPVTTTFATKAGTKYFVWLDTPSHGTGLFDLKVE